MCFCGSASLPSTPLYDTSALTSHGGLKIHDIPVWWSREWYRGASHESCGCTVELIKAIKSEGRQLKERVEDTATHTVLSMVIFWKWYSRFLLFMSDLTWKSLTARHQCALSHHRCHLISFVSPWAEGHWFACGQQVLHVGHIIVTLLNNITGSEEKRL